MYYSDRYSIMDRNILLDDYWKDQLAEVYEHIKRDCAPGDYDWNRRGIIVADDETGELLALVKEALKYDEMDAAGIVNDNTVVDAAREAMQMASRSVGLLGSKGMFER